MMLYRREREAKGIRTPDLISTKYACGRWLYQFSAVNVRVDTNQNPRAD